MDREANFWKRMMAGLWKPNRVLNRIENGVLDGMTDTYIVIDGSQNMVELKAPVEPARLATPLFGSNHKLTQVQMNWLLTHRQAGGRGWVAIETETKVWLVGARNADRINHMNMPQLDLCADFHCVRPTTEAHWAEFVRVLKTVRAP